MDKKELIEKLRENARLNLDSPYDYNRGCGYGYENARLLAERLEPDKVEVPRCVADYIDEGKGLGATLHETLGVVKEIAGVYDFIKNNENEFAEAWLHGYVVKEELLYYVHLIKGKANDYLNVNKFNGEQTSYGKTESATHQTKFTEAEIKAIDPRYWPFAEKVEEERWIKK